MEATRSKHAKLRALKFKRKPRKLSKRLGTSWPGKMDDDGSVQGEGIDRLLVSSLRFWEVERDLIEERVTAMGR